MQIFLVPRSNETSYKSFLSTIENGVDFSIVEPYLDERGNKILKPFKNLYAWGSKETKKSSWDKMEPDDLVLFYKGKDEAEKEGKFMFAGRLLYKQHSQDLGIALWPPKLKQEPWVCVFFLKDLKSIYIPSSVIADYGEYSKPFIVQGFMPFKEEGTDKILKEYGNIEKFLAKYSGIQKEIKSDLEVSSAITAHADAELLLLKIGILLGYETYSPDRNEVASEEKLSKYITLTEVPLRFLGKQLIPLVKEIDIIWFKDEVPKFAFEVEHSTKFGNGFQRMCQLIPLSTKLFIISSTKNSHLFEKFINTDPYYKHKKSFRFRDYTQLENYFTAVARLHAINDAFLK